MGVVRDPVQIGSLAFNGTDWRMVCDQLDGWDDGATPEVVIVPNGGGDGAVAGSHWFDKEKFITAGGAWVTTDRQGAQDARDSLIAAVTANTPVQVTRFGRSMLCRLYDTPVIDLVTPRGFRWTTPLVALDPYQYAATADLDGLIGVFNDEGAFVRTYPAVSNTARTYPAASNTARTYTDANSLIAGPPMADLFNVGSAPSRRLTAAINGPLLAGDWRLTNETTGEQLWVDATIPDGQFLTVDMAAGTAILSPPPGGVDQDVTYLVFGDWLTLNPGSNPIRLSSGSPNTSAFATLTGYSAWK